jgi:hypothetical protein
MAACGFGSFAASIAMAFAEDRAKAWNRVYQP